MLTPAVHQQAVAFAVKHAERPAIHAIADGYETGYCRGYQARPLREPYPNPLAVEQQRLLAPYVAEQVEVYHPGTGCYGLLKGLPYALSSTGSDAVIAEVEWYPSVGSEDGPVGDIYARLGVLLPVLWGWPEMGTEIELPDGQRIVPMVELCRLLVPEVTVVRAGYELRRGDSFCIGIGPNGQDYFAFGQHAFERGSIAGHAVALLRTWSFAVGLRPDQYQRRVAGHDYRTGVPGQQEGKEVGRG